MTVGGASVVVGTDAIADVSPYVFGALTEHFGEGLYGGVWERDGHTPRADVAGAVRGLGTTMLRYPGGCFSDWYHWRDGVGPKEARPTYESTYWTEFEYAVDMPDPVAFRRRTGPVETNAVGTDEFLQYCTDVGAAPMLAANFGSGTPEEAAAWVAYTNRNPDPARRLPRVDWWCVGNESYGPWEIGHCGPAEYARRLIEFSQAMRAADRDIALVAVGAMEPEAAGFPDWNTRVCADAGDHIDALSVHWYFPGPFLGRGLKDDEDDYYRVAAAPEQLGELLDAVLTDVDRTIGPERRIPLALDEWNMWDRIDDLLHTNRRLCDAVFFAGCYNRMIERADRVRFAMVSHLVNCMGPIQTRRDRHFVTSAYLVGALYAGLCRRTAVPVAVESATFDAKPFEERPTQPTTLISADGSARRVAPVLDASATVDATGTTVFLVNRSFDEAQRVELVGLGAATRAVVRTVVGPGPFATNRVDDPFALHYAHATVEVEAGKCRVELPPYTVAAVATDV